MTPISSRAFQIDDGSSISSSVPLVLISAIEQFNSYMKSLGQAIIIYCRMWGMHFHGISRTYRGLSNIDSTLRHLYSLIFDGHDSLIVCDLGITMTNALLL